MDIKITPINEKNRAAVDALIREGWAGPYIASRGRLIDTRRLPGFAAELDGELAGYALYELRGGDCEIAVIESLREGRGIGSGLIAAAVAAARAADCRRVWLITTNDNCAAMRFYLRRGFRLTAVHLDALRRSRELKPGIPAAGIDGVPLLHELEFELPL